ncbi:hypothetical protein PENTCL1PPCAC_26682, partial [Pristionchus entomophagus]
KCNDCNEKFIEPADLLAHCFDNDHSGSYSIDHYKHRLVEEKVKDNLFFAKNGMEELMKMKKMNSLYPLSAIIPPVIPIATNKTVETREVKKEKEEKPSKEEVDESTTSRRSTRLMTNSKTDGTVEPPQKKSKSTKTDEKQPSVIVKKSNKDKNEEKDDYVVDCVCGQTEEDEKKMVQCDECKVWRHISCIYPVTKKLQNPNNDFFCHKCQLTPRQAREFEDRVKVEKEKERERLQGARKKKRDYYRCSAKNATVMTRSKSGPKRRK